MHSKLGNSKPRNNPQRPTNRHKVFQKGNHEARCPERLHQSCAHLISAPPNKIRAINPGGAVRLGVFGRLSVTSSTNAKTVKITAAVAVPIHERGVGTFSQPKCAAQAVTAAGVRDRNPVNIPIKNANSRT
jgi:hypothetical protein